MMGEIDADGDSVTVTDGLTVAVTDGDVDRVPDGDFVSEDEGETEPVNVMDAVGVAVNVAVTL